MRVYSQYALNGGNPCEGKTKDTRPCFEESCSDTFSVDCLWSQWSNWSTCSKTCGTGIQERQRQISQFPENGGKQCDGEAHETKQCLNKLCSIDCEWSQWSNWNGCSKTCGTGVQERQRQILRLPENGGRQCTGEGYERKQCLNKPCPIDCKWSQWQPWTPCSTTCGNGYQKRSRFVTQPAQYFGKQCLGGALQTQQCNNLPCPVDCQWSQWSIWTPCSKSCGTGSQHRSRTVTQQALNFGKQCVGEISETQQCNNHPCPVAVDCQWSQWSMWTPCSKSCNSGFQTRQRAITQHEMFGGNTCHGEPTQSQQCNSHPCPINCEWGQWSSWSKCSRSCNGGIQNRYRSKLQDAEFGGHSCSGQSSDSKSCNEDPCPRKVTSGFQQPMDIERWNSQTGFYQENSFEFDNPKIKSNYPKGFDQENLVEYDDPKRKTNYPKGFYQENLFENDNPKRKTNYPKGFYEKFDKSNTKSNLSEKDGWSRDGFYSPGSGGINNQNSISNSWNSGGITQHNGWTRF